MERIVHRHGAGRILSTLIVALLASACSGAAGTIEHQERWGIYQLDLDTEATTAIFESAHPITTLHASADGTRIVFTQQLGADPFDGTEIAAVSVDGTAYTRLTDNQNADVYPRWSPRGNEIAFLTSRNGNLDIYVMDADGGQQRLLHDSGSHDADIDWSGDQIAFTRDSQIWLMNDDGSNPRQVTDYERAGEWGDANLPFGDYDPRIDPTGARIAFERLIDDSSPHGNYEIFIVDLLTGHEMPLTGNDYSQGFATWSTDGRSILYIVAAIGSEGLFDLYMVEADGSNNRSITPDYYPPDFICREAVFGADDSSVLFVGEWWQQDP